MAMQGARMTVQPVIREVWANNLNDEFELIREIIDDYPLVAFDTEFPGTLPTPSTPPLGHWSYGTLKYNVDTMHLIQVGITLFDQTGQCCTWQFNFKEFNPHCDKCNPESIKLLSKSGIDFEKNRREGIDSVVFAELLMSSGIVLNNAITFVIFSGAYDIAYLLELLTGQNLPNTVEDFYNLMNTFFPTVYDIKFMMNYANYEGQSLYEKLGSVNLRGSLKGLAQLFEISGIGTSHTAGFDSFVTFCIFLKFIPLFPDGSFGGYARQLYALR